MFGDLSHNDANNITLFTNIYMYNMSLHEHQS